MFGWNAHKEWKGVNTMEEILRLQAEVAITEELVCNNVLTMSSRGSICL
jgi:hypothetical protein